MGDSEEKIEYSPEEQEEIDRVLSSLPVEDVRAGAVPVDTDVPAGEDISAIEGETLYESSDEPDIGALDDLMGETGTPTPVGRALAPRSHTWRCSPNPSCRAPCTPLRHCHDLGRPSDSPAPSQSPEFRWPGP